MKKIEINIPDGYYFDVKSMSVKKCPIQTFEFVDLGLPSGTLWATYNVGANKDIEQGNYLTFEEAQKYNCPSKEQIKELIKYASSIWITKNDVNGRLFIGKNGNFIFLPASGYRYNDDCCNDNCYTALNGLSGRYWSGTFFENNVAFNMVFSNFRLDWDTDNCNNKYSVRPVKKFLLP